MKLAKIAILGAALTAAPFAAQAQDVGTTIYGNDDATVGTVSASADGIVTVDTGTYKAPLPAAQLAEREGKWTVNATKAQINSMMAAQKAEAEKKLAAALVTGAAVMTADSQPAGSILAIDDSADQVIVENEMGIVSLKREHFALSPEGGLTALFSAQEMSEFTTEVPEGAEIRTASGVLVRGADGSEPGSDMTVDGSDAMPEASASR